MENTRPKLIVRERYLKEWDGERCACVRHLIVHILSPIEDADDADDADDDHRITIYTHC